MEISKKEEREIITQLFDKFSSTNVITYEYIEGFLHSILNGETSYDSIVIPQESINNATNQVMDIRYFIQNKIYHKLCTMTGDDIDILLYLVDDKRATASFVLKKLGISDESKIEDYLIEALQNFRGDENLNSYITRYIMAAIKGKPFVFKSDEEKKEKEVVVEDTSKKKKKKKNKNKNRDFVNNIEMENSADVLSEEVKYSNETLPSEVSEPVKIGDELNDNDSHPKDDEDFTLDTLEQQSNEKHLVESVLVQEEIVEDTLKENVTSEQSVEKQEFNPYLEAKRLSEGITGTGVKDNLVVASQKVGLVNILDCKNNANYEMYLLLRLGFINRMIFTKEEISRILGISILQVINYERDTWEVLKKVFNERFNGYEDYVLNKGKK